MPDTLHPAERIARGFALAVIASVPGALPALLSLDARLRNVLDTVRIAAGLRAG